MKFQKNIKNCQNIDLGEKKSIHKSSWPKYDKKLIEDERVLLIVQINGKVRDKIEMKSGLSQQEAEKIVFASDKIKILTEGKEIVKTIFVPNKLINIVIKI